MSRLDSAIRRLEAQRLCLDHAVELVRDLPGIVVELGLGNGRTFDHLRERLPAREILVFDRQVDAHPDCVPDPAHLVLGDFRETLPAAMARWRGAVALAHADTGTGDKAASVALAAIIAPAVAAMLAPGGIAVSDQPLPDPMLRPCPLPPGVAEGRYYLYAAVEPC